MFFKIRSTIIGPKALFSVLFIIWVPRPKIKSADNPTLTLLLIITLIKDLSLSKSLLFIKCVAL